MMHVRSCECDERMNRTSLRKKVASILFRIPEILICDCTLIKAPFLLFTEADIQSVIYQEFVKSFKPIKISRSIIQTVHVEYPPKGTKHCLHLRRKVKRRCHDIVILDGTYITEHSGELEKHYNRLPMLACVEIKHRWNFSYREIKNDFLVDGYAIMQTMRYDDSLKQGMLWLLM